MPSLTKTSEDNSKKETVVVNKAVEKVPKKVDSASNKGMKKAKEQTPPSETTAMTQQTVPVGMPVPKELASKDATPTSAEGSTSGGPEVETFLTQALNVIEKKVRNLEKRKGKLDGYRATVQRGKDLNDDQKAAIAKYDEVAQNLDFSRELAGQFKSLQLDEEKSLKKSKFEEQQKKNKADAKKFAIGIELQGTLSFLTNNRSKKDFLNGTKGAVKIPKETFEMVEALNALIRTPAKSLIAKEGREAYEKAVAAAGEHLSNLAEGRSKRISAEIKMTYKDMKSLILDEVAPCTYFEEALKAKEKEEKPVVEEITTNNTEQQLSNGKTEEVKANGKSPKNKKQPQPTAPVKTEPESPQQQEQQQPEQVPPPHHQQQIPVQQQQPEPVVQQQQQQHVQNQHPPQGYPAPPHIPQQPQGISFMRESTIDMESPHMDPAVVVVHNSPPQNLQQHHPQQQTQQQPQQQQLPPHASGIHLIPPTTLAAMHQFQQQLHGQQAGHPHQGAPGFPAHPQQQQMGASPPFHHQQQQQPVQQQLPSGDHQQMPQPPQEQQPQHHQQQPEEYVEQPQPSKPVDTLTNIADWNAEMDAQAKKSGGEDGNVDGDQGQQNGGDRRNGFRGGRGGGGFRGGERGSGGGYRGERRGGRGGGGGEGGYRGGRGGYNRDGGDRREGYRGGRGGGGGNRDGGNREGGYRDGGNREGGYRGNNRRGDGERRGGGDRGGYRPRGGQQQQQNGH